MKINENCYVDDILLASNFPYMINKTKLCFGSGKISGKKNTSDSFSREDYNRLVRYLFFKGIILKPKTCLQHMRLILKK